MGSEIRQKWKDDSYFTQKNRGGGADISRGLKSAIPQEPFGVNEVSLHIYLADLIFYRFLSLTHANLLKVILGSNVTITLCQLVVLLPRELDHFHCIYC